MKKVAFRLDASLKLGVGHLVRCLTLANKLVEEGASVSFICSNTGFNYSSLINKKDFNLIVLENNLENFNNQFDEYADAQLFIEHIKNGNEYNILLIDHYQIGIIWENEIRKYINEIIVIDDLANRKHNCDILLDQNMFENALERYEGLLPEKALLCLGPSYALLRDQFTSIENKERAISDTPHINILFGGTDPANDTDKAIDGIAEIDGIILDVIVGENNPHKNSIKLKCNNMKNVNYYQQVKNIAAVFNNATLGIGAGGSSVWEKCCLGIPSIVICTAENQIKPMLELAKKNVIIMFEKDRTPENYRQIVIDYIKNETLLAEMSRLGQLTFDGFGTTRFSEIIMGGK